MKLNQKQQEEIKMNKKLPEICYSYLRTNNEIILLKNGEKGYYKTDFALPKTREEAKAIVKDRNEKLGVSRLQRACMEIGSMFGFNVPGADPDNEINVKLYGKGGN